MEHLSKRKKKSLNEQVNLLVQPKKPQDSLSGVWPSSRSNFSKALSGLAANKLSLSTALTGPCLAFRPTYVRDI